MLQMVVTDLDGTLLTDDRKVSENDLNTLYDLGKRGITRVIATGRSPYSFARVIDDHFPIDYLVFSSGTGVMDYRSKEVLLTYSIPEQKVKELAKLFRSRGVSFKVLSPVPDNHHYLYFENGHSHPDFYRRMEYYRGFETPISFNPQNFGPASQFLIILPPDVTRFNELKDLCSGVKVVRATSPIDHESIWMELFHPSVSKASGVDFLCRRLEIPAANTMGIGNDYNDIDLLAFTQHSFMVANGPEDIRNQYQLVSSNNESGFTRAVKLLLE